MALPADLRHVASSQRCLFTTDQARASGLTRSALAHRVRTGELVRIAPRVYCLGGVPLTVDVRLGAALLEAGGFSALCRASAAAHWGFPGFELEPIHVLRARDGAFRPMTMATRHTTTTLPAGHVAEHDGIRVTTPARTLFDLAAIVGATRLERLIDHAWARRQVSGRLLRRTLVELSERGRGGLTIMRTLLAERDEDYRPPESSLEARFQQLLRDDGQAPMERQIDLGEADWLGRVDFVDIAARLIVEIDSELHHTSISDRHADEARQRRLEAAGWRLLRVREHEVWHDPSAMLRRVREARRHRPSS